MRKWGFMCNNGFLNMKGMSFVRMRVRYFTELST
jgi:hypothetical protein